MHIDFQIVACNDNIHTDAHNALCILTFEDVKFSHFPCGALYIYGGGVVLEQFDI